MTEYISHLKKPLPGVYRQWLDDTESIDYSKPPNVPLMTAIKKAVYTSLGEPWVDVDGTSKGN